MKFTEEKRLEIADAIQIRCSGSDYLTFQYEELDRMVDDIDKLVNENNVIPPVMLSLSFAECVDINCMRCNVCQWTYKGDNYTRIYSTKEMFTEHQRIVNSEA